MSKEEKFVNPKVLHRLALAVEWEGNLEVYKNGKSNQGEYMAALGILWGRWMREDRFDEAWAAAKQFAQRDWAAMFLDVLRAVPSKIEQLKGFYQGVFGGSLKLLVASRSQPPRFGFDIPPNLAADDQRLADGLGDMFRQIATTIEELKNG